MTMEDDAIRASDHDRERVIEVLGEQTSQGRLTLTEFEDRTARVYQARTWHELRALVEDLPVQVTFDGERAAAGAPAPVPVPTGPRQPAWRSANGPVAVLLVLVLVLVAVGVAFAMHKPAVAIVPFLVVARIAYGGAHRLRRGHRTYGRRWR